MVICIANIYIFTKNVKYWYNVYIEDNWREHTHVVHCGDTPGTLSLYPSVLYPQLQSSRNY